MVLLVCDTSKKKKADNTRRARVDGKNSIRMKYEVIVRAGISRFVRSTDVDAQMKVESEWKSWASIDNGPGE